MTGLGPRNSGTVALLQTNHRLPMLPLQNGPDLKAPR